MPTSESKQWDGTTIWKRNCASPFGPSAFACRGLALRKGEKVEVTDLASAEECETEMFVTVTWEDRKLAVLLSQWNLPTR